METPPQVCTSDSMGTDSESCEALAKGLSTMLASLIQDFDSKSHNTLATQHHLNSSIDRLTKELDQLLEDAPLPFIMQHAVKISGVRKRVLSLNSLLKSIQRRLDNIDRIMSVGTLQEALFDRHGAADTRARPPIKHVYTRRNGRGFPRAGSNIRT